MHLAPWMAATSTVHLLQFNVIPIETAKVVSLKIAYTGWEGSATDAWVYQSALTDGLDIPPGKYYLADTGFPSTTQLLIPYRSVRYHLAEWGWANVRYIFMVCLYEMISKLITGPKIKKNCLTSLTHQLAMSLSSSLVS